MSMLVFVMHDNSISEPFAGLALDRAFSISASYHSASISNLDLVSHVLSTFQLNKVSIFSKLQFIKISMK